MSWRTGIGLLVFTLGVAGALTTTQSLVWWLTASAETQIQTYKSNSPEEKLLKQQAELLAAGERLQQSAFFNLGSRGQRSADHLLDPLLLDSQASAFLVTSSAHKHLRSPSWPQSKDVPPVPVDARQWFQQLRHFDHWSSQLRPDLIGLSPNLRENLLLGTRQLLLHCRRQDCLQEALEETRQLARLLYTLDDLNFLPLVVDLLRSETDFFTDLSSNERDILQWQPLKPEVLSAVQLFFPWLEWMADPRLSNEAFLIFFNHPIGRCLLTREALKKHLPLLLTTEREPLAEPLRRLTQIARLSETSCRTDILRNLWNHWQNPSEEAIESILLSQSQDSTHRWLVKRLRGSLRQDSKVLTSLVFRILAESHPSD